MTPVHEAVLDVLGGGGALFFRGLADQVAAALSGSRVHATDQAVASAIWDLVWAGRLTNDTLAPLRTVLSTGRPVTPVDPPARRAAARTGARRPGGTGAGGRPAPAGRAVRSWLAPAGRRRAAAVPRRPGAAAGRELAGPRCRRAPGRRPSAAGGRCWPPRGGGPDPAAARAGHLAAGAARHRAARRGGRRAGAGRVQRDLPGAAGHGGRRPVPPGLLRRRARARPSSRCRARSTGCGRWPRSCRRPARRRMTRLARACRDRTRRARRRAAGPAGRRRCPSRTGTSGRAGARQPVPPRRTARTAGARRPGLARTAPPAAGRRAGPWPWRPRRDRHRWR